MKKLFTGSYLKESLFLVVMMCVEAQYANAGVWFLNDEYKMSAGYTFDTGFSIYYDVIILTKKKSTSFRGRSECYQTMDDFDYIFVLPLDDEHRSPLYHLIREDSITLSNYEDKSHSKKILNNKKSSEIFSRVLALLENGLRSVYQHDECLYDDGCNVANIAAYVLGIKRENLSKPTYKGHLRAVLSSLPEIEHVTALSSFDLITMDMPPRFAIVPLTREHFMFIKEDSIEFILASELLKIIKDTEGSGRWLAYKFNAASAVEIVDLLDQIANNLDLYFKLPTSLPLLDDKWTRERAVWEHWQTLPTDWLTPPAPSCSYIN